MQGQYQHQHQHQQQQQPQQELGVLKQSQPVKIQRHESQQDVPHSWVSSQSQSQYGTSPNPSSMISYSVSPPNNSNLMSSSLTNTTYFSPSYSPQLQNKQQYQNMYHQREPLYANQAQYTSVNQISQNMMFNNQQHQQYQQPQQQMQHTYSQQPQQQTSQKILYNTPINQYPQYLQQQNISDSINSSIIGNAIKTFKMYRPYFQLELYVPKNLRSYYEKSVAEHNQVVTEIIMSTYSGEFNAGFDLFVPSSMTAHGNNTIKIDHQVKCRMTKIVPHFSHPFNMYQDNNGLLKQYYTSNIPVGFYLYPRSSTGGKTPLRLANSVGIIDSGYRGPLISVFDNWKKDDFEIQEGQRLVQICSPDLTYPIYVILVDSEEELGKTKRGSGGFGSTG